MILSKSERKNDVEISTDLVSQYYFPIKLSRLLREINDRAQRGNIEEESGRFYCIRKEVVTKIIFKKPWTNVSK